VNSLPKTLTRQRRDCDLNQGLSAPESSTLTTRLPSHPVATLIINRLFSGITVSKVGLIGMIGKRIFRRSRSAQVLYSEATSQTHSPVS